MKKSTITIIVCASIIAGIAYAAEEKASDEKAAPQAAVKKELTKEETVTNLKTTFKRYPEVLGVIPGLKVDRDADGNAYYTYNGVKLDELDKETLRKIYTRARSEVTRIRIEKLNRQLESIRQGQAAARAAEQASRVSRVVTPPQPPQPPPQPVSTPQTPPKPPPQPPQGQRR